MARFDTVVKNGLVVIPYVGQINMDIGIREGRIAALEDRIDTTDADELIDASGKVVLPGGVDTHFHLGIYRDMAQDTESETTSSTVGGVTTVVSYARTGQHYLNKSGPYREIFPEILERVAGHARVDYGFHLAPMLPEHIAEIPWLVSEMGVSSFKYFMFYKGFNLASDSRDAQAYTMSEDYDLGHLFEIMEKVAEVQATTPGPDLRLPALRAGRAAAGVHRAGQGRSRACRAWPSTTPPARRSPSGCRSRRPPCWPTPLRSTSTCCTSPANSR